MSSRHAENHETLLERVVTGELLASDPAVLAQLSECPECRERLSEVQRVMGQLTRAGELESDALRDGFGQDTRSPATAEHEERTRAFVHAQLGRARRPSTTRRVAMTLATAAGLVLVALLYRALVPAHPGEVPLGDDHIACERPVGEVADFGTFSWRFDLPKRGRFELSVWDDSSPEGSQPLVHEPYLTESRCTPELEQWPERIRWEVRAYDAGDQLLRRSEPQRAWRSR